MFLNAANKSSLVVLFFLKKIFFRYVSQLSFNLISIQILDFSCLVMLFFHKNNNYSFRHTSQLSFHLINMPILVFAFKFLIFLLVKQKLFFDTHIPYLSWTVCILIIANSPESKQRVLNAPSSNAIVSPRRQCLGLQDGHMQIQRRLTAAVAYTT